MLGLDWEGTFITFSRTSRDLTESSPIFLCLVLNSHVLSSSQPPPPNYPYLETYFNNKLSGFQCAALELLRERSESMAFIGSLGSCNCTY